MAVRHPINWLSITVNADALTSVYNESEVERLRNLYLHEASLLIDGPCLLLRFDLPAMPKSVPKAWLKTGYNCVQLTIRLLPLNEVQISGFAVDVLANVEVYQRDAKRYEMSLQSDSCHIQAAFDFIAIQTLSAYVTTRLT